MELAKIEKSESKFLKIISGTYKNDSYTQTANTWIREVSKSVLPVYVGKTNTVLTKIVMREN